VGTLWNAQLSITLSASCRLPSHTIAESGFMAGMRKRTPHPIWLIGLINSTALMSAQVASVANPKQLNLTPTSSSRQPPAGQVALKRPSRIPQTNSRGAPGSEVIAASARAFDFR
jgi:hypothetical protein